MKKAALIMHWTMVAWRLFVCIWRKSIMFWWQVYRMKIFFSLILITGINHLNRKIFWWMINIPGNITVSCLLNTLIRKIKKQYTLSVRWKREKQFWSSMKRPGPCRRKLSSTLSDYRKKDFRIHGDFISNHGTEILFLVCLRIMDEVRRHPEWCLPGCS